MYKLTNTIASCIIALIFFSCTKTVITESAVQAEKFQPIATNGTITPAGTPQGVIESKIIGSGGGSFGSSDSRLFIKFPAGALSRNTTITIQAISNQTPGGTGYAYRLTPHGAKFAKPVSITFNYSHDDLLSSMPAAMSIAYQDSTGVWQAMGEGMNDTAAKKVTINTTHFSDWSLFKAYEIVPNVAFVTAGSVTPVKVVKRLNTTQPVMPLPAGPVYDSLGATVKTWTLSGAGALKPNNNLAVYTAPLAVPAIQPVTVSAELETTTAKCVFKASIFIGGGGSGTPGANYNGQGVVFRVDKGSWRYAICPNGIKLVHTSMGDERFFTAIVPGSTKADALTIHWMGQARAGSTMAWKTTFPDFQYSYQEKDSSVYYFQYALPSAAPSAGSIKFLANNEMPGSNTAGSFIIATSGRLSVPKNGMPPAFSNHQIDGFFNIPWAGN